MRTNVGNKMIRLQLTGNKEKATKIRAYRQVHIQHSKKKNNNAQK